MAVLSTLNLPPGFRFSPTEEELIDFLRLKIAGNDEQLDFIREVQFFTYEPWDLPGDHFSTPFCLICVYDDLIFVFWTFLIFAGIQLISSLFS
jgi:hypothetical protein